LTVEKLALKYVVITSVTRDDLSDGGGIQFSRVIHEIRKRVPECRVEVLVPDFDGRMENLERVLEAGPSVLNHNIETVRRLYPRVRPGADYHRSLELLGFAGTHASNVRTKSGLMVGLGETTGEVLDVFRDLRAVGCEMLTVGQYLRPTAKNLPVCEYVHPDVFQNYRKRAEEMGFVKVESAPLVRSSMNAEEMTHV